MIPEQGEGLFGMAFEITGAPVSSERRRSTPNKREKELLQILEATTDGIWQWNLRDHKILLSSKLNFRRSDNIISN